MLFIKKNFYYLYSLLLAWQLILLVHYIVEWLTGYFSISTYDYYQSVVLYFNGYKKLELLEYMLGIVSIGIWFTILSMAREKIQRSTKFSFVYLTSRISGWVTIVLSSFIFPILLYASHLTSTFKFMISLLFIVISMWLPYGFRLLHRNRIMVRFGNYLRFFSWEKQSWDASQFYKFLILIAYIQLIVLFYEPIFQNIKIITEYLNIDETSILDDRYLDKQESLNTIVTKLNKPMIGKDLTHFGSKEKPNPDDIITDPFSWTKQEKSFLEDNQFELHWQVLSRFMIHHNSFVYVPSKEFELGKPVAKINAQYGLGFSWLLSKVFAPFGGISIDKWLRFSYGAYYLYFFLFVVLVQKLVKDWRFTAVIFLLSMVMINTRGYEFLLLPPGESPWRHFFDLWSIFFVYYFGRTQKIIYYWAALFFGIVSIGINPQIGVMIFVAVVLVGLYAVIIQKTINRDMFVALAVSVLIAIWCFQATNSTNDLAQYYIDGVIGFPIATKQLFTFLSLIAIGYSSILILSKRLTNEQLFPLLLLFFYSQELLVYVIWHYNGDGLKARAFIYVLTIGLILYYSSKSWPAKVQKILWGIVMVYTISVYSYSIIKVNKSKHEYNDIFRTHKTYSWEMAQARFISTMDPKPFVNDANLISRFSDQNGVYIISEYDNILPFLANKYSKMPFFDLKWYLITPKEVQKSINILVTQRPQYLFVDTRIDRDLSREIVDSRIPKIGYLNQESIWRVQRLMLLKDIFDTVRSEYELIEKGALISVYKRKDTNEIH